ncbi:MAG: hypothetical protein ACLVAW_04940 [Eisenbergiella massiliensis]
MTRGGNSGISAFMDNVCSLEAQNLWHNSTNMTCGHWMQIAHAIEENYEALTAS